MAARGLPFFLLSPTSIVYLESTEALMHVILASLFLLLAACGTVGAQQQPDAAMRHLMTFNEMKKRCDLWHLHVLESGLIAMARS